MKKLSITFLLIVFIMAIGLAVLSHTLPGNRLIIPDDSKKAADRRPFSTFIRKLNTTASVAKLFAQKNSLNTGLCFLVDMSIPSGQKRFFIYDLHKDSVLKSGLVTHGNCNQQWLEGRKYDNTIGCGCTSLGKYKIGYSYTGRFGLAFKLHGLEKTNSNAFARYIVLHSHSCVPETEVANDICQSNGCPTVSPGFLKELEEIIKASDKPVLLWLFD